MRKLISTALIFFSISCFVTVIEVAAEYYSNSYALVIGIDRYPVQNWPDLSYAKADAEAVADILRNQGFQVIELYDRQATKIAIVEKMQNHLSRVIGSNDRVLVFFAGHGYTENLAGKDWGYIVPYHTLNQSSAGYISMEELQTLSRKMGKAKHQLFIMVSCYGGLLGTRGSGVDPDIPNYLTEVTKRKARLIITAGGKDQEVVDDGPKGLSVFTGHLVEAIKDSLADINGDGYITYSELVSYLVPIASNDYQTPASATLPGHGMGEFVFRSLIGATRSYGKTSGTTGSALRSRSPEAILSVLSNVYDDIVFINGEHIGSTRVEVKLPVGWHRVRVEKEGYTPFDKQIYLQDNQILHARLDPLANQKTVTALSRGLQVKHFIISPDKDTVIDTRTNLMWMRNDSSLITGKSKLTWDEAMALADKINAVGFSGYRDWYVPSIAEYRGINRNIEDRKLYLEVFAKTDVTYFWSRNEKSKSWASNIDFPRDAYEPAAASTGLKSGQYVRGSMGVRLVRNID